MHDNKVCTRDAAIANILIKHFTSIAEKYSNHSSNNSHSPIMMSLNEFIKHKLSKENIFKKILHDKTLRLQIDI